MNFIFMTAFIHFCHFMFFFFQIKWNTSSTVTFAQASDRVTALHWVSSCTPVGVVTSSVDANLWAMLMLALGQVYFAVLESKRCGDDGWITVVQARGGKSFTAPPNFTTWCMAMLIFYRSRKKNGGLMSTDNVGNLKDCDVNRMLKPPH